jgi:hypothetical protein
MFGPRLRVAKLDKGQLTKLQTLEKKMGCCIVALQPEPRPARLSKPQIRSLRAVEKELGVVLVAYEAQ